MLSTNTVFRRLYLADPYALTEQALRTELSTESGGRPVGAADLATALSTLKRNGHAVDTLNDDQDTLWSLTAAGRTEAIRRFA